MAKIIYCKESVAQKLIAEYSAQTRNEDITGNTFVSSMAGVKVIPKDDEYFIGMKTKDGEPADAIIVDESAFKIDYSKLQFDYEAVGKPKYEITVYCTPEANDLIKDGSYEFKRIPDVDFPEAYTNDGARANVHVLYESDKGNFYALKCIESEVTIDELMVEIEELIVKEGKI